MENKRVQELEEAMLKMLMGINQALEELEKEHPWKAQDILSKLPAIVLEHDKRG